MISLRLLLALPVLASTAGCASFNGQATPVLSPATVGAVAAAYPPQTALATFYGKPVDQRKAYRDEVIGAYLAAADLQFLTFRQDLSRQTKGTNVGFDLAILALTGTASLTGKTVANGLSAGAAGLTGSRAAIAKELWFDKTLPALLTAMEARRTVVRTTIMTRMREPAESYSLAEALNDLMAYQAAASLDAAIETVTTAAGEKASAADALYQQQVAFYSAPPETGVAELRRAIKGLLAPKRADADAMKGVATAIGVDPGKDGPSTFASIMATVNAKPSIGETQALLAKIKAQMEQ